MEFLSQANDEAGERLISEPGGQQGELYVRVVRTEKTPFKYGDLKASRCSQRDHHGRPTGGPDRTHLYGNESLLMS